MRGIVALVSRCKIIGGQFAANDEASSFRWTSEADVRDLASEAYAVRSSTPFAPSAHPQCVLMTALGSSE